MRAGRFLRRCFGSVRVRVAVVTGAAFAIALTAGSVLLLRTLEHRLIDDVRTEDASALQLQAQRMLVTGVPAADQAIPVPGPGGQVVVVSGHSVAAGAGVAASAEPGQIVDVVVDGDTGVATFEQSIPFDYETARLLGLSPGQAGTVLVSTVQLPTGVSLSTASSLGEVERTLSITRTLLWYLVPALVLLVAGAAWLLVGRALRPVHALTSRASTISAQSLHERVPVPPVDDEVSELATTINSMLARIEAADLASRRLVSDASHELRTPIAVIRTELEVARRDPSASWSDVSANVLIEVDRLQGLVDDLLLLARMSERRAGDRGGQEPFDLLDTVRDVAGRKRRCGVTVIDGADSDEIVLGDAAAVQRALDHVVANAARHADSRVEVRVEAAGDDSVAVHVDDDGPGIPVHDRARVLDRFERLDEGRSRDAGGSGLGLAVAVDVLAAHGGSVAISDSPLGGARVSLLLPCHAGADVSPDTPF